MKNPSFPTIRAEIAALENQINALDLPQTVQREALSIAKLEAFVSANRHIPAMGTAEKERLLLESERHQAQSSRTDAERDARSLNREIEHLKKMLNADDRALQVQKEIDTLAGLANAAQASVDAAMSTHQAIESMVAAESVALDKAKGDAASAVLSQIKSGKPGKLPHVDSGRLDALGLALDSAAAELVDAEEVLAECVANVSAAQHDLDESLADTTARALHIILRDYAHALRNHKAASYRCGRRFDVPDVDMLIRQLDREAVAVTEGD